MEDFKDEILKWIEELDINDFVDEIKKSVLETVLEIYSEYEE